MAAGIIGVVDILIILTMPETFYQREESRRSENHEYIEDKDCEGRSKGTPIHEEELPRKKSWNHSLSFKSTSLTNESLLTLFFRPIAMLLIVPIIWTTLILGLNVGFGVMISTTIASSLSDLYGFQTWQIGLFYISNVIGALLGLPFAGALSDYIANSLTKRNHGIREPEMR